MAADQTLLTPQASLRQAAGAWVWDILGERLYGDARFANLTGLDPEAAIAGLSTSAFFDAVIPEDNFRLKIAVAGVLHGAETFAKEYRVRGADDTVRWVSGRGRGERDSAGALVRFTGVLTDVTEQKRVEERLRVAQTAGGVGTFEHVDGFGTAEVSDQFCRLLGLQPTDALPVRTINALVEPGDPLIIRQAVYEDADEPGYSELRVRRADTGEVRWLARRGEHRADRVSYGPRFIGVIYDITASKLAETELRDLNQTLEQRVEARTRERDRIWNRTRDLFVVMSLDGVYRSVNPAWTSTLGYAAGELIGRGAADLVHPDDREAAWDKFRELRKGNALENFDMRVRGKDGEYRWFNWTIVLEDDAYLGMGRDVTERKQLEDQLRQSQKMEAVGQLTGGLAHDFNNMLTGIIGGLDLARRRLTSGRMDDANRFMDAATTAAQRAAALTHRLLAFSRRQSLDVSAVDVAALLASMEDMLRRTLGEQISLRIEVPAGLWLARSDTNQLESAILNLAINARDAMPEGGKLTVEAQNLTLGSPHADGHENIPPGDYVLVGVSDTGVGMPEDVKSKVFEPFYTTKPLGQGTGLGLSMIYGFVHQTGGRVGLYSEIGLGTSIKLYLPRNASDADVVADPRPRQLAPRGGGETLLVVEDDDQVRLLILQVLRDLGYDVLEATNGDGALRLLEADRRVDLVVTDVGLPGLNGRQMADLARDRRPHLPILFVTGYAPNATIRAEFLSPGMTMISKPFSADALGAAVRDILDAAGQGQTTPEVSALD